MTFVINVSFGLRPNAEMTRALSRFCCFRAKQDLLFYAKAIALPGLCPHFVTNQKESVTNDLVSNFVRCSCAKSRIEIPAPSAH